MDSRVRPTAGAGRLRTLLLTCLSVVLSALGHSLATGAAPSWGAVAAGSAAVSLVVLPLTRRRRTVPENGALLALLQLGLHVFFSATMPQAPMAHSMGGPHPGMEPSPWTAYAPAVPMVCAHVVAAFCVARLLRAGDVAAARVTDLARLYVAHAAHLARGAVLGAPTAARPPLGAVAALLRRAPRPGETRPGASAIRLAHEVTRRGPPRWMAAPVRRRPGAPCGAERRPTPSTPVPGAHADACAARGSPSLESHACVRSHDSVSSPPP